MLINSHHPMLKLTSSTLLLSWLFYMAPANADNAEELKIYKRLRDNGIITELQFEALAKSLKEPNYDKKSGEELIANNIEDHVNNSNEHTSVENKGSLSIESSTGEFEYKIGGHIQVDAAKYSADNHEFTDGTEFRRLRLFVKGKMYKKWLWKAQFEFAGNQTEIKDMYLGYKFKPLVLRVGQFNESGSLEDSTSSKYITFMERSLPILAFSPGEKRIGIGINSYNNYGSYSAGIFGDNESADEIENSKGASTRVSYAPWHGKTQTLHLGLSLQYRTPAENRLRYRARPEAHVDDTRLVNTGSLENVSHYTINGLEAAWVSGPFSLQGEYIRSTLTRTELSNLTFDGYYAYASWFITGESRPYKIKSGTFGRVKPKQSGGLGAWEVALRYSQVDLNDQLITGGEEKNITLGLNWHPNPNIRFMFNYIHADTDVNAGNIDPSMVQMRAQVDY